jgi:hypothetical protein
MDSVVTISTLVVLEITFLATITIADAKVGILHQFPRPSTFSTIDLLAKHEQKRAWQPPSSTWREAA